MYENKFRLNQFYDMENLWCVNENETVLFKNDAVLINSVCIQNVRDQPISLLNILKYDTNIQYIHPQSNIHFIWHIIIIEILYYYSFLDFMWFDTNIVEKNLTKIVIIIAIVLIKKIYIKSFYTTLKVFMLIYSITFSLILLSFLLIPSRSYFEIQDLPEHKFVNNTNSFFNTQEELSLYSYELKNMFILLYTSILFPFYFYVFINLIEYGIISSVLTIGLLNINIHSISSFVINLCLSVLILAFTYIFSSFKIEFYIQKIEEREKEIMYGHLSEEDYKKNIYYNKNTNIYVITDKFIKNLKKKTPPRDKRVFHVYNYEQSVYKQKF